MSFFPNNKGRMPGILPDMRPLLRGILIKLTNCALVFPRFFGVVHRIITTR